MPFSFHRQGFVHTLLDQGIKGRAEITSSRGRCCSFLLACQPFHLRRQGLVLFRYQTKAALKGF
ncbi:hypothetical protein D9M73_261820 [compost metagenome]